MKTTVARKLPAAWQAIARVFTALGDEQRQRILLTFDRGEQLNVTQIVEASTLSRPAISHHLKILREAGILNSQKKGKEIHFWINKDYLQGMLQAVLNHIANET